MGMNDYMSWSFKKIASTIRRDPAQFFTNFDKNYQPK